MTNFEYDKRRAEELRREQEEIRKRMQCSCARRCCDKCKWNRENP